MEGGITHQRSPAPPGTLPPFVRLVAWIFVFWGVVAVIWLVFALARGHMPNVLGVLGLPIGHGLLRGRSLWRAIGLIFLVLVMINCVVFVVSLYRAPEAIPTPAVRSGVLTLIGLLCTSAIGMFRVLVRADVREFYESRVAEPADPSVGRRLP